MQSLGDPKRVAGQTFESCPAATGADDLGGCPQFPDRAHRCAIDRGTTHAHICTCGQQWYSAQTMAGPRNRPFGRETKGTGDVATGPGPTSVQERYWSNGY